MTPSRIIEILQKYDLRPLKQLGQNFLADRNLCAFIIDSLEAPIESPILEIGPGLGALTDILIERKSQVTVLEVDRGFCKYLTEAYGALSNFKLIEGDALETLSKQPSFDFIIGNLPYHISTPLLIAICSREILPLRASFTLQKEVAQRLVASPRTKDYGAVTVFLQTLFKIENIKTLPAGVFFPQPKVDSSVVRLHRIDSPFSNAADRINFYEFLKKGFSHRRKMLRSVFPIDSTSRAEELSLQDWLDLYEKIRRHL